MRLLSLILVVGLIALSVGSVERMLDIALKILPAIIKDEKKLEMFKGALIAAKGCLEPIAQKAGEDTVEKFLEMLFPAGSECGLQVGGFEDVLTKRKEFSKCFYAEVDVFLEGKSQTDKDAFMETKACFKEIFGDHE